MAAGSNMTLHLRTTDAVNSLTHLKRGLFGTPISSTRRAISLFLRTPIIRKRLHKTGHHTKSHRTHILEQYMFESISKNMEQRCSLEVSCKSGSQEIPGVLCSP